MMECACAANRFWRMMRKSSSARCTLSKRRCCRTECSSSLLPKCLACRSTIRYHSSASALFSFFFSFFLFLRRQSGISQVHLRFFRAAWSSWVSVSMYIFLHRPCTCAYSCTNIAHACACACACIHSYCPHMHTFCTHMCLCRTCLTRTRVCAYMHTRIAHIWALAGTCTRFMHSTDVHVLTHTRVSLLRACLLMHTHDTHLTQTCHKRGEF
jgi:hypothetical protein